jgi:hypothetical protein
MLGSKGEMLVRERGMEYTTISLRVPCERNLPHADQLAAVMVVVVYL